MQSSHPSMCNHVQLIVLNLWLFWEKCSHSVPPTFSFPILNQGHLKTLKPHHLKSNFPISYITFFFIASQMTLFVLLNLFAYLFGSCFWFFLLNFFLLSIMNGFDLCTFMGLICVHFTTILYLFRFNLNCASAKRNYTNVSTFALIHR